MKSASTWYSAGSSWPDLPNGGKISSWLHQFPRKLAVYPGVGIAQLTISKFSWNPPSSCAARHPPAFEQLEYYWPWNIMGPPIDPIFFGQLRLSAVERSHNKGWCPRATWWKLPRRADGEFNGQTSENHYVISILPQFVFEIFLSHCVGLAVLVYLHPVWWGGSTKMSTIFLCKIIQVTWIFILNCNNHTGIRPCVHTRYTAVCDTQA
jgi:hypothetical protein